MPTARPRQRAASETTEKTSQRARTASAAIYRALREEIVSMHRKPGEPIVEKQIARTYGVSRTPVREAVLKLADENLVDIFPQAGTFVSRIPVAALPEAILIRRALEEATVRYAAERATPDQIAALRANLARQREVEDAGDRDGFHEADEAFHALIAEAAGYPGFWAPVQQVKVQVDRYRHLTLPEPGRMNIVLAEHTAIVDAIEDHDPARAMARMIEHLEGLRSSIVNARETNPFYFSDPESANPQGGG